MLLLGSPRDHQHRPRQVERLLPGPQGAGFGWLAPSGPTAAIVGAPLQSHARRVSCPGAGGASPAGPGSLGEAAASPASCAPSRAGLALGSRLRP